MKTRIFSAVLLVLLAVGLLASCAEKADPATPGGDTGTNAYKEWISDPHFERGVNISGLRSDTVSYTPWNYDGPFEDPAWQLGQYCDLSATRQGYDADRNDLSPLFGDLSPEPDGAGGSQSVSSTDGDFYTLTNASGSKRIAVNKKTSTVILTADTTKEYIDPMTGVMQPRREGEDWVHMILQQQLSIPIAEQEEIIMSCEFSVKQCDVVDDSIGAAQFQWVFSVSDVTRQGKPGSHIWFLVSLYDNRYEIIPAFSMVDSGKADASNDYMYAPGGAALFGEENAKIRVGRKYRLTLDLKAQLYTAFNEALAGGYLDENTAWENMRIDSFNIGWEVSNVSVSSVEISDISLTTR